MKPHKRIGIVVGFCLLVAVSTSAGAQPVITELNGDEFPRSGRVAITGIGLGAGGTVLIAGIEAWTATWKNDRVVAYVPESAPLGPATVVVELGAMTSNEFPLTVTERQSNGRVRWTFETDGWQQYIRPALAPDGTIYMHTNNETDGLLYALSPEGGLKWIRKVNWYPYVPPTAGPDGEVYVGSINTITRISPQGEVDWTFSGGNDISASPTIGPDGLLYGAYEVSLGAFALDSVSSDVVWSNDPDMSNWGQLGTELRFGRAGPGQPIDRFYVGWEAVYAFSLDGDYLFVAGTVTNSSHEPAIGSDGTIYVPGWLDRYLVAHSPDDGAIMWDTDQDWLSYISDIDIGADDTLFFISDGTWMHAYDPHSQTTEWRVDTDLYLRKPTVSPDSSFVLTSGGGSQGQIPFVKSFSTETGEELWHLDLQDVFDPAFRYIPWHRPRISADNSTAYVPSLTGMYPSLDDDPRATLFAVDTGQGGGATEFIRGDSNQDQSVDIADAIHVLDLLFGGAVPPVDCEDAADCNDDGTVDISDPIYVLGFLFNDGMPPPAPHPNCGVDSTGSDPLLCESYVCP